MNLCWTRALENYTTVKMLKWYPRAALLLCLNINQAVIWCYATINTMMWMYISNYIHLSPMYTPVYMGDKISTSHRRVMFFFLWSESDTSIELKTEYQVRNGNKTNQWFPSSSFILHSLWIIGYWQCNETCSLRFRGNDQSHQSKRLTNHWLLKHWAFYWR